MADPLYYEPPKPSWGQHPSADEELRALVELLHERGVLRLTNDVLGALPEIGERLMGGIHTEAGGHAMQNITALIQLIGHMPPEDFRRLCKGIERALHAITASIEDEDTRAPGVSGSLRMLHDDELWAAVMPMLRAAQAFTDGFRQSTDQAPHPARPEGSSV